MCESCRTGAFYHDAKPIVTQQLGKLRSIHWGLDLFLAWLLPRGDEGSQQTSNNRHDLQECLALPHWPSECEMDMDSASTQPSKTHAKCLSGPILTWNNVGKGILGNSIPTQLWGAGQSTRMRKFQREGYTRTGPSAWARILQCRAARVLRQHSL